MVSNNKTGEGEQAQFCVIPKSVIGFGKTVIVS